MVKSISDNKEFYKTLADGKFIEDELWNFIDDFVPSFQSVFICTKTPQEAQLTFGDFICSWMELKMNLAKRKTDLSEKMLKAMEVRQKKLLDNDICRAALFLDPRFNFFESNSIYLSSEGKKQAEEYLLKVYSVLCNLNPSEGPVDTEIEVGNEERSKLECFYDMKLLHLRNYIR